MEDLKIRLKCEEMIQYGYQAVQQFPRAERHVLSQEIRLSMWRLLRLIVVCNKRYHKKTTMQDLDAELDLLRSQVRAKMKRFANLYATGKVTLDRVRATVHSWVGHARHADSYRVRERILGSAVFMPPGRDHRVDAPEQDTNNPTKEGFL